MESPRKFLGWLITTDDVFKNKLNAIIPNYYNNDIIEIETGRIAIPIREMVKSALTKAELGSLVEKIPSDWNKDLYTKYDYIPPKEEQWVKKVVEPIKK